MRGPEEMEKSMDTSSQSLQGENKRDPCSSPPCKKLKQAVLSFPSNSSSLRNNDGCGGLVTAAPSSPISTRNDEEIMIIDSTLQTEPTTSPSSHQDKQNDDQATSPSSTCKDKLNSDTPFGESSAEKKKKDERETIREVKRKEKEEKIKLKEEAKAAKEKEKIEAKQKKQAEREKREKERLDKKLKEEKERQEKKEKKEEEKRKKEEEHNAKLEEKRRKEEEKKQHEEEMERKKQKAKNTFKSFFTKTQSTTPKTLPKSLSKFEPFEIKPYMSVAPVQRIKINHESKEKLDSDIKAQNETQLYLCELKKRKPLPVCRAVRRRRITQSTPCDTPNIGCKEILEVVDDDDDDDDDSSESSSVVEVQDDCKKAVYMKAVFFKFCENNRPPYYGTQRKTSIKISPRNPFRKDETELNYEVDSDDEWEEEEPGESLLDSEPEDNEEANEAVDEEEEDGWMVPHGYLSDDEGIDENDCGDAEDVQQEMSCDKKEQQLAKAKAWEKELKKKCKAMKPICVGCIWPEVNDVHEVLKRFEACILVDEPSISINTVNATPDDMQTTSINTAGLPHDTSSNTAMCVPHEAMLDLVSFVHGSSDGLDKLVNNFRIHWSNKCNNTQAHPMLTGKGHISKRQLNMKIRSIAKKESRLWDKSRWYVHPGILANYGLEGLNTETEPQRLNVKTSNSSPGNGGIKCAVLQPAITTSPEMLSNQIVNPNQVMLANQVIVPNRVNVPIQEGITNQGLSGVSLMVQQSCSDPKLPSYTAGDCEQQTCSFKQASSQSLMTTVNQPVPHRSVLQTLMQNNQEVASVAVKRPALNQDCRLSKVIKSEQPAGTLLIIRDNDNIITNHSQ